MDRFWDLITLDECDIILFLSYSYLLSQQAPHRLHQFLKTTIFHDFEGPFAFRYPTDYLGSILLFRKVSIEGISLTLLPFSCVDDVNRLPSLF